MVGNRRHEDLDLDDVLVDYSRERRCRALAASAGASPEAIERAVFGSGLEKRSDRGEFGLDDYMDKLRSDWGLDIPGQDFIAARRAATRRARQSGDDQEGQKRPDKGPRRDPDHPAANAQDRDRDGPCRGPRRDAQKIGIGQRIAHQRLKHNTRERQPRPAGRRDQCARQAVAPDDARIDGIDHMARIPKRIGDHVQNHA